MKKKCDCEHADHETTHIAGGCTLEAKYWVKAFGLHQNLCRDCMVFVAKSGHFDAWGTLESLVT